MKDRPAFSEPPKHFPLKLYSPFRVFFIKSKSRQTNHYGFRLVSRSKYPITMHLESGEGTGTSSYVQYLPICLFVYTNMVIIYKCSVSTFSFSIFDPRLTSDTALLVQLSTAVCSMHSMAHAASTLDRLLIADLYLLRQKWLLIS